MIKVDLLIRGNALIDSVMLGGGNLYQCPESDLANHFDCSGAICVDGEIRASDIKAGDKVIVVTGAVIGEGCDVI